MNNEERIKWINDQLSQKLQPSFLAIVDNSHKHKGHAGSKNGAGHFTVEIWSPLFEQKPIIECHRMIYEVLQSAIPNEIHALKIKLKKESSKAKSDKQ